MKDIGTVFLSIFGAIVGLAILSVIVGQKSTAPAAIQAAGTALAKVVAAAVNPVTTANTNGNLGASTYTTPAASVSAGLQSWGSIAQGILNNPNTKILE